MWKREETRHLAYPWRGNTAHMWTKTLDKNISKRLITDYNKTGNLREYFFKVLYLLQINIQGIVLKSFSFLLPWLCQPHGTCQQNINKILSLTYESMVYITHRHVPTTEEMYKYPLKGFIFQNFLNDIRKCNWSRGHYKIVLPKALLVFFFFVLFLC